MYKLIENGVKRLSDGACIPSSESNRDWRAYQEWLAEEDENGNLIGNQPLPQYTLEELKERKLGEIRGAFESSFNTNVLNSVQGFKVDNRRSGHKHDRDNLQALISLGQFPIAFKDAEGNLQSLDQANAEALVKEMAQDGLGQYTKKWLKEAEVEEATTEEELEAISWNSGV